MVVKRLDSAEHDLRITEEERGNMELNRMEIGKKCWVFADGDLPPKGESEPFGHEALMMVNAGDREGHITMDLLFEDKEPKEGIVIKIPPKRVKCVRMDDPLGEEKYEIPFGQFAVVITSDVPIVAVYGRLDRRENMAYYPIAGYSV